MPDVTINNRLPWGALSIVGVILLFLFLPILATIVYAFSQTWGATILPQGFTFQWFTQLWTDPRFIAALGRSLMLGCGTIVLAWLVLFPACWMIVVHAPWLDRWMALVILLPFALPPVVASVGLLNLYAGDPLPLVGSPWVLLGCDFTIILPFVYRALVLRLQHMQLPVLLDAARLLGASTWKTVAQVVLPGIRRTLLTTSLLSLSFLMGEFVFANLLAGTRFETLQVYLFNMRQTSGHFTSALVISYFAIIFLVTWVASRLNR